MATGYGSSGRYGNSYRFNPYAQRSNQGSLLQFAQSNQPYIGRPVNQLADSLAKIEEGNRALVDKGNIIDMAMSSIEVDPINQDIMDQERINMRMGVQDISESDNFNTASAKLNKLVSAFQGSQGVKTAISLKEQRTKAHSDINEMYKKNQIIKSQYDDYMNINGPQKAIKDSHGFYNDIYESQMPAQVYDVAGLLTSIAGRFRVNKAISEPKHHFDPQTGELLYVEFPSSEFILKGQYLKAFKEGFNSNPGAKEFLEDTMPEKYKQKGGGGVDAYINTMIEGFASSWAMNKDATTFQAGTVANAVNAARQHVYALDLDRVGQEYALDRMEKAHGYTMAEIEARNAGKNQGTNIGGMINGNMVLEEVETPNEAKSMNFKVGLIDAMNDISANLKKTTNEINSIIGLGREMVAPLFTTKLENREQFDAIDNMYAYINDGQGIDFSKLNDDNYVKEVQGKLKSLTDMLADDSLYITGYMPEHSDIKQQHAANMLFSGKTRLHPSELQGNYENRKILIETANGVKEITPAQFKKDINSIYKEETNSSNKYSDEIKKNGLTYNSGIIGASNPYVMLTNNEDFSYSRRIEIPRKDGEPAVYIISDAHNGTELKHYADINGEKYYVGSSNSKEHALNVSRITGAMVNPAKGINLPSVSGANIDKNYKVKYHANRPTDEEKASGVAANPIFSMYLDDVPGIKGVNIFARNPSDLYLKYKAMRKKLSESENINDILRELADANFFFDAAEKADTESQ